MLSRSIILFFVCMCFASTTIAYSVEAYASNTFKTKKTSDAQYTLKTYFKDGSSCWYASVGFLAQPACCLNNGSVYHKNAYYDNGEKWNKCITVRKDKTFYDVKMTLKFNDQKTVYTTSCTKENHLLAYDIKKERSYCNNSGCLTKFGWVNKPDITKIENC